MRPNNIEIRQLRLQDERLSKFKESNFTQLGLDEPNGMFLMVFIFSIPFFGWALLFIYLLAELFTKWFRMVMITIKAFWFYIKMKFK